MPAAADAGPQDPALSDAVAIELIAALLRSGQSLSASAATVSSVVGGRLGEALGWVAELDSLGLGAEQLWQQVANTPSQASQERPNYFSYFASLVQRRSAEPSVIEELARVGRRSARSGAALADGLSECATRFRETEFGRIRSKAGRAGALIGAPLALCFLPAFVCLGIAPSIIGLATSLSTQI